MQATNSSKPRTLIITGANKGIGYAIVESLLKGPTAYNIILTARNVENGQKALETLKQSHSQSASTVAFHQLDLDNESSQDSFVEWVKKDLGTFDILVNNAGIASRTPTNQQKADTINTNFVHTVSLTNKLLPYLSADGKIITISSTMGSLAFHGPKAQEIFEDPNITEEQLLEIASKINEGYLNGKDENEFDLLRGPYQISKTLLNGYTRWVLSKKVKGEQQVYTICPGWCKTDLGGQAAFFPVEHGAETPVFVINLPFAAKNELNNKFVRDNAAISWADTAYGPK